MGKNKKKKLALKKETVRKLDTMSAADLNQAAGGTLVYNFQPKYQLGTATLACIRTTTGTCGCEPTGGCGYGGY
jgi:hypothetical protein